MKTAQQIIQEKAIKELISIESDRPVVDALIIMAEYRIGALIVMQKKKDGWYYFRERLRKQNRIKREIIEGYINQ